MKWFHRSILATAVLVVASSLASPAFAQVLPITGAEDYVFSNSGILYISTSGGNIDRYDTQTNSFLTPFSVGGSLLGMDLSPDGKTLAVANTTFTGFDLVSTSTGAVTPVSYTPGLPGRRGLHGRLRIQRKPAVLHPVPGIGMDPSPPIRSGYRG